MITLTRIDIRGKPGLYLADCTRRRRRLLRFALIERLRPNSIKEIAFLARAVQCS